MLTPAEIAALREYSLLLTQPVNDFLLKDIARRVAKVGKFTSTAEYQMYRAQFLGADMPKLKKDIEALVSEAGTQMDNLFKFVESKSLDFAENKQLQQITDAYLKASKKDLETLLKTKNIGFVAPDGHVYPLQNAYLKTMDYAVRQVITGAADYNTAIRQATKRLADSGIRTLPQKNGRNIGIEYAVRRYVMNNISAVATNINEANHDAMGADGWELSAHAASAPDHEPYQGRQFTDKEYAELNNSLVRRIGTLSCKHIAYPIILGISRPAYSEAELKRYIKENADGITYKGQRYTLYQAEQIQRGIENEIRHQKSKSLIAKNLCDKESLQSVQIKLNVLKGEYKRFSSAADLRTSSSRMEVPGFGRSKAVREMFTTASSDAIIKGQRVGGDASGNGEKIFKQFESISPNDTVAIEKLAKDFRVSNAKSSVEKMLVIAKNGEVYYVSSGHKTKIDGDYLNEKLGNKMQDSYNIHNHPPDYTQFSFSTDADIPGFFNDGSAVMDAFDYKYRYRFERPPNVTLRQWEEARVAIEHDINGIITNKYGDLFDNPELFTDVLLHTTIEEVCKKLNIQSYYKRWKINE